MYVDNSCWRHNFSLSYVTAFLLFSLAMHLLLLLEQLTRHLSLELIAWGSRDV